MLRYYRTMCALIALVTMAIILPPALTQNAGYALRFHGNGTGDIDRVKISLGGQANVVNVGADFTIEFFIRANQQENSSGACTSGESGWINGNIIIDRDVFGPGDFGDYGVSLFGENGVIAFGVSLSDAGETVCGKTNVADGEWHHIALTRDNTTGLLTLYVDGIQDGQAAGPVGDVSYRAGRSTQWPNDAFLVIGAEKHDYDSQTYRSFSGWLDELRISHTVRYVGDFSPPTEPFVTDEDTVGLYHFDEGEGDQAFDSSETGNHGAIRIGGKPSGPEWSSETPFAAMPEKAVETAMPPSKN